MDLGLILWWTTAWWWHWGISTSGSVGLLITCEIPCDEPVSSEWLDTSLEEAWPGMELGFYSMYIKFIKEFVFHFRMIDWVSWPLGKNIDKWIIALLKGLAAVKKFSILIEVTLSKIEKVSCECEPFF